MKKIAALFALSAFLIAGGCTSPNYEERGLRAPENEYEVVLEFNASKEKLRKTTEFVLAMNRLAAEKNGQAIIVRQTTSRGRALLCITFEDGAVYVDATGSTYNGNPSFPEPLVERIEAGIARNLNLMR